MGQNQTVQVSAKGLVLQEEAKAPVDRRDGRPLIVQCSDGVSAGAIHNLTMFVETLQAWMTTRQKRVVRSLETKSCPTSDMDQGLVSLGRIISTTNSRGGMIFGADAHPCNILYVVGVYDALIEGLVRKYVCEALQQKTEALYFRAKDYVALANVSHAHLTEQAQAMLKNGAEALVRGRADIKKAEWSLQDGLNTIRHLKNHWALGSLVSLFDNATVEEYVTAALSGAVTLTHITVVQVVLANFVREQFTPDVAAPRHNSVVAPYYDPQVTPSAPYYDPRAAPSAPYYDPQVAREWRPQEPSAPAAAAAVVQQLTPMAAAVTFVKITCASCQNVVSINPELKADRTAEMAVGPDGEPELCCICLDAIPDMPLGCKCKSYTMCQGCVRGLVKQALSK